MACTELADVALAVQKFWGPRFDQKLRCQHKLAAIVNKTPGGLGSIRQGDTVKVTQVEDMAGQLQPTTDCSFTPETLSISQIEVVCDQRAVASLEFCDLVELKSQISLNRPEVRDTMAYAMNKQINSHLYGKAAPTTEQTGVANIDAAKLIELGKLADEACWPETDRWLFVDACYYADLVGDAVLTSADFGASDTPVIGGSLILERYGWKIVKDTTVEFKTALNGGAGGVAMAFLPDWLYMVMMHNSRVKMSDRHSNNVFKVGMSVDTVFGAALSNDGADKHIIVRSGA